MYPQDVEIKRKMCQNHEKVDEQVQNSNRVHRYGKLM